MTDILIIPPKTLAVIFLAALGQDVAGFVIQMNEQLLIEVQSRALNFAIQYETIAVALSVVGAKFVDPTGPAKLFAEGWESLSTASNPEEAISGGTIAVTALFMAGASSKDANASASFAGFLMVFAQNLLLPGCQAIFFSKGLVRMYVFNKILFRIITEIRVERKRRELGLPRAKLKFHLNIFKKE